MKKFALFAFNGESMCFVHVLLNGLDMRGRGHDVKVVIEGAATKLLPELFQEGGMLSPLFRRALEEGLLEGVCKACSAKMGTLGTAEEHGLRLLADMSGHPSIARYLELGYDALVF